MSERLTRELNKLKYANLVKVEEEHYKINKNDKLHMETDKCYLIRLNDSIYNQDSNLINWNNGRLPKGRFYQVEVTQVMGNMIKVSGIGFNDLNCTSFVENWFGWLPMDEIDVINKI